MKKSVLFFILPGLFFLLLFPAAQSQVTLSLTQPPPNQWMVEDMWNLFITNAGNTDQNIYLRGTLEEATEGKIAEATSATFILPKDYTGPLMSGWLTPVKQNYFNRKYEDIVRKTGTMPSGKYIICVTAYNTENNELAKDCIEQVIENMSPPQLTYPMDQTTLMEKKPVLQWMPPMPTPAGEIITFKLKIVELLDGQVPIEAVEANPAFFIKEGIPTSYFQFPLSARPFVEGKSYAWQVTAYGQNYEIGKSPVWSFNLNVLECHTKTDSIKVECNGKDSNGNQKYKVTVQFFNLNNNPNCVTYLCYPALGAGSAPPAPCSDYLHIFSGSCTITNVSPMGGGTPIPYSSTIPTIITFNMTNPVLPVKINIETGIICGTNNFGIHCPTPFIINKVPDCLCDDCEDMKVTFDDFNTSAFGTSGYQYNIVGNININKPIYDLECQVQSYKYAATPPSCSNGVNTIEQSGMFLRPATSLNGTTSILVFNETISGSPSSNNNAIKAVKLKSTTPITGPIPVKLLVGMPGPIAGLPPECCKMTYTVCVKVIVFYDAKLCKSCTFIHCFDFTNQ